MATKKQFGTTWWGKAWLDALEQRAIEDPNRLGRGRTYARQERVQQLELSPGLLRASVWGNREEPYVTTLSMRVLTDEDWDVILDAIMDRATNVAALLAGEVPHEIGHHVLPDRGDLGPECSCPDWAEPCKHVAALCYVAADLFDRDPFALLTLRGRGRDAVLTEVRSRRSERLGVELSSSSGEPRGSDPGISGAQMHRREVVPLERSAVLGSEPAKMTPLAVAPGVDAGIDLDDLADLVNDAARRAWAMLAVGDSSQLDLTLGADVVRRAATGDIGGIDAIAKQTGLDSTELEAAVVAWEHGGVAGFDAHRSASSESDVDLSAGIAALGTEARVRGNAITNPHVQLRRTEDGSWWRFDPDSELGWVLVDGPAKTPDELL